MKHIALIVSFLFCISFSHAQKKPVAVQKCQRVEKIVNSQWTFNYFPNESADKGYESPGTDDSKWIAVSLPHTWSTYETTGELHPFIRNASENDNPYWWTGWGWYRKHFSINKEFEGRRVFIEFEGVQNFPSEKDNLTQVPFGVWDDKLLFAGIKPLMALDDILGDMKKRIGWLPLSNFKFDATRSRDYLVKAHWALYVENYLEGFHVPFVHNSLNAVLDYGSYKTELYRYANLQLGLSKSGEDTFDLPPDSPDYGQHVAAYYYWVFPNLM